jgi:hypothetical protein
MPREWTVDERMDSLDSEDESEVGGKPNLMESDECEGCWSNAAAWRTR